LLLDEDLLSSVPSVKTRSDERAEHFALCIAAVLRGLKVAIVNDPYTIVPFLKATAITTLQDGALKCAAKSKELARASRVPDQFLIPLALNPFAYGVGRGNGVGLGLGVGGGRVADGVGVTLGVTVVVAVAVAVAVGVAVAVAVAVGVGVNVAVAVGVGLGLPQGSSHLPAFTITLPQSTLCGDAAPTQ